MGEKMLKFPQWSIFFAFKPFIKLLKPMLILAAPYNKNAAFNN